MAQVCPVVGTTNTVLPPSHPSIDASDKSAVCPVTNASLKHHTNLDTHPSVPIPNNTSPSDASKCPALKNTLNDEVAKRTDEDLCPVVGTATTVLPPDHPSVEGAKEDTECPVTKAKVGHHVGKVHEHPKVLGDASQCPVVGATA